MFADSLKKRKIHKPTLDSIVEEAKGRKKVKDTAKPCDKKKPEEIIPEKKAKETKNEEVDEESLACSASESGDEMEQSASDRDSEE